MIDILLATYNGQTYLQEMLDSLKNQDCADFNVLVRDDGSSDETLLIVEKNKKGALSGRLFFVEDAIETGSAKENFFALLEGSEAEYMMFADQDDVWERGKVRMTLEAMQKAEGEYGKDMPILVHSDLCVTDGELRVINPSLVKMQKLNPAYRTPNRLLAQNNVTGCTVMINRALAKIVRAGDKRIIMHDWWLALAAAAFGKIVYIKSALTLYRQHGGNEVGAKDVRGVSYFRGKMSNTKGIHQSILDTYAQADAFLESYYDIIENKALYETYAALGRYGKLKRFRLLSKYRFYKSGLYRKIGQILYG